METAALRAFLDAEFGASGPIEVEPMTGGGSCEIFSIERGDQRWVLRRAPRHASSSTAHDVLREFRILSAIRATPVRIPRPIVACADPSVFESPFYVMDHVDGVPVRATIPESWVAAPDQQHVAVEELFDALADIHAVDWQSVGLHDLGHPDRFLERQVQRWLAQLESYGGRPLPAVHRIGEWLEANRPPEQPPTLIHGDFKFDNVLFATDLPPRLLAVVDWEMATIGDPLLDVAWALIFHPEQGATMPFGVSDAAGFSLPHLPSSAAVIDRYAQRTGRDVSAIGWYHVLARWKLAIVLEGSFAKWQRGESSKPFHEWFGPQADKLLASATEMVEADERNGA